MKHFSLTLLVVGALAAMLLSACGPTAPTATPVSPTAQAIPVEYTGVVESMDGTQWVISGRALTIDPAVVRDGPFQVGDTVKLAIVVIPGGALQVTDQVSQAVVIGFSPTVCVVIVRDAQVSPARTDPELVTLLRIGKEVAQ